MNRDMRNPRTEQVTGAHEGVRPGGLNTPNSTGTTSASHAAPPREMHSEAAEDVAVRLILERDPVALACHRLGLESRSLPKPSRLHPDDVALIARQVAVEIQLGEQRPPRWPAPYRQALSATPAPRSAIVQRPAVRTTSTRPTRMTS